jgi:hypothetical protein
MVEPRVTTDHRKIKNWVEARGGRPAVIATGEGDDPGALRIEFPDYTGEELLREITWEEFFDKFEDERLAFLYQEDTASGGESRLPN